VAFDLDAVIASREPGPFTFTFGGKEWAWPPALDLRATAALLEGRVWDALQMQFGPEQYAEFMATGGGFDEGAVAELFKAHAAHLGSSLGESSASSSSSGSTARRSKPTSKRSTKKTSGR
jgi:hypothetical protein